VDIKHIANGRVLFIGVGNPDRGDDGVGPFVINELLSAGFTNALDVGTVPENFTGKIIQYQPDTVIIIDAVSFGGTPGSWKLFSPEDCSDIGFSTHTASLQLFASYLKQRIPVTVYLLGVQPETIQFQTGLSPQVEKSLYMVVSVIKEIQSNNKQCSEFLKEYR